MEGVDASGGALGLDEGVGVNILSRSAAFGNGVSIGTDSRELAPGVDDLLR